MGGFLAAALVGFTLARAADRGQVLKVIEDSPKWRAVHRAVATGGVGKVIIVVGLVRLAPGAPFSLTNLVMATMCVPVLPYAASTALGMAPRTTLLVYAASRLNDVGAMPADEPWLYAAGALTTAAVMAALAWIAKIGLARATSGTGPADE